MRKQNPKHRWHVTDKEKKEIARLTRAHVPQSSIARILGIGRDTVAKWQVRMNLPTVPPLPEDKIMELFEKSWGGYRIAKHLGVAVSAVYKVAHKNKFRRADGIGYPQPHGDIVAFTEAVKRGEGYIKELARKHKVGFCQARRIAHEVRACPEFRRGLAKPPLSSNFPQRHYDQKLRVPDQFVTLVERVSQKCFVGSVPRRDYDAAFVGAMLAALVPETIPEEMKHMLLANEWARVRETFAAGLVEAVDCLRRTQEARWQN